MGNPAISLAEFDQEMGSARDGAREGAPLEGAHPVLHDDEVG